MSMVETVCYTVAMTSPKLGIGIVQEFKLSLLVFKKVRKKQLNTRCHLTMDMVPFKIVWEMCILYSQNHPKKTWRNYSQMTNLS